MFVRGRGEQKISIKLNETGSCYKPKAMLKMALKAGKDLSWVIMYVVRYRESSFKSLKSPVQRF